MKIIGTFFFRRTDNGNLIGEYTNNKNPKIETETAVPIRGTVSFEGEYQSQWFDGEHHRADLSISRRANKFALTWTEPGSINYSGEGILMDGVLIGYYISNR